jgi:hypothetical protein
MDWLFERRKAFASLMLRTILPDDEIGEGICIHKLTRTFPCGQIFPPDLITDHNYDFT